MDELVMQAITEKLQEIDNKIENLNSQNASSIEEDIEKIKEKLSSYHFTLEIIRENIRDIPRPNYSNSFNEVKQQIKQLGNEFESSIDQMQITNKQKLIGLCIIGGLTLLLIISVILNKYYDNKIDIYKLNSIKFRYMQTLGNDNSYNATLVTDSIFKKYDHESIENAVQEREELIRKKVEAEVRLKAALEHAQELQSETNRLNSLLK